MRDKNRTDAEAAVYASFSVTLNAAIDAFTTKPIYDIMAEADENVNPLKFVFIKETIDSTLEEFLNRDIDKWNKYEDIVDLVEKNKNEIRETEVAFGLSKKPINEAFADFVSDMVVILIKTRSNVNCSSPDYVSIKLRRNEYKERLVKVVKSALEKGFDAKILEDMVKEVVHSVNLRSAEFSGTEIFDEIWVNQVFDRMNSVEETSMKINVLTSINDVVRRDKLSPSDIPNFLALISTLRKLGPSTESADDFHAASAMLLTIAGIELPRNIFDKISSVCIEYKKNFNTGKDKFLSDLDAIAEEFTPSKKEIEKYEFIHKLATGAKLVEKDGDLVFDLPSDII